MAGEKVGEAYVDIRYRLTQLAGDLRTARTAIDNQVEQINRSVAQKTDGMLSGISTQLQGVTALTGAFGAAVLAAVGSQAIQAVNAFKDKIAETGSAFQQMQARIDQTLGAGAFEDTIAMANRLGVAIKDAADSTARFGMAAQDIGLTKDQVLLLTETVVKLGRVGNSSAEEMSNGMQQLGQALASGKFQGDELRSVLESMPEVARALAKELGVTIGQLREMGTEGKLTADVVAKALLGAADDAAERFAKLPESLEQSQARWQNATDQLFAALDKALGASKFVQWWNKFKTDIAEGIAVDLGGGTTETQVKVLTDRLEALRKGDWFGENARLIEEVEQQLKAATMFSRQLGDNTRGYDTGEPPKLTGPASWSLYPERTLDDEKAAKGLRDSARQVAEEAQAERERLNARAEAETERHNAEMASLEQSRLTDFQRDLDGEYKLQDEREQRAREANERLARANQEARQEEMRAAEEQRWQARQDDPAGYYAATGDPELAPVYDAATGAREAMKELGDESVQYGKMLGDAIKAGADTAADALTEMALTGKFAIKDLLKDLAELALNQVFRMAINSALGAAGSAMFGSTAAPQGGAGGNHAGLAGYARGGVFDRGHVVPLARGGIVSAATIVPLARGAALMGEAGPEAVMPLARDGSGRLGVRGGGGGGTKVIINDMRGAGSPPVKTEERPDGQGGIDIVATIEATVEKGLGGGRFDAAMRRFGNRPQVTR
jgi:lambda family phage tail tape measure protein